LTQLQTKLLLESRTIRKFKNITKIREVKDSNTRDFLIVFLSILTISISQLILTIVCAF